MMLQYFGAASVARLRAAVEKYLHGVLIFPGCLDLRMRNWNYCPLIHQ